MTQRSHSECPPKSGWFWQNQRKAVYVRGGYVDFPSLLCELNSEFLIFAVCKPSGDDILAIIFDGGNHKPSQWRRLVLSKPTDPSNSFVRDVPIDCCEQEKSCSDTI